MVLQTGHCSSSAGRGLEGRAREELERVAAGGMIEVWCDVWSVPFGEGEQTEMLMIIGKAEGRFMRIVVDLFEIGVARGQMRNRKIVNS